MADGSGRPVAACYLGQWAREALDKALEQTGWMHSHYVRIAILEKLERDGVLPAEYVEREVKKAEYRKDHPHGNTKRARQARDSNGKYAVEEAVEGEPERASEEVGNARLVRRREIRRRQRAS